jgi:iron complex outermembrane receptor protein
MFILTGIASAQSPSKKQVAPSDTASPKKLYIIKQAIVVEADRNSKIEQPHHYTTIESALQTEPSVSLIRRGNFALEPILRGMSGGQVAITIDGMKIHSACVDKMDPITAYIEPENLRQLEISTGSGDVSAAQTQGGTLNLVTVKPNLTNGLSGNGEVGWGGNSPLFRLRGSMNYSFGETALRGSFSMRKSGDYSAGDSKIISNSGFQKENYKFDLLHKFSSLQDISFAYIRDDARKIGYPALIMDATKTQSNIVSVDYKIREVSQRIPLITAKLYWNSVYHLMDDYSRSIAEIEHRIIMPGMYMPMEGKTQTIGLISDILFATQTQTFKLTIDMFHLSAFADMNMLPISKGAAMHVVNLADVGNLNSALAAEWNFEPIASDFRYSVAARFDYSKRSLRNFEGKNAFTAFLNSDNIERTYSVGSINSAVEYSISHQTSLRLSVARASRLPTHIENYGFYLYNPLDNAIYMGNPSLEPEHGWQSEFGIQHKTAYFQFKATTFTNYIENYIAGNTIIKPDTTNTQFPQAFRRYESIGTASLMGIEADILLSFDEHWSCHSTYRWQIGRAIDLQESLPWMPPMEISIKILWQSNKLWVELSSRITARQTAISHTISVEDETPGFLVLDLRAGVPIGESIVLNVGIENILDKFYWEYSSVRNLPSIGRNVHINANVSF